MRNKKTKQNSIISSGIFDALFVTPTMEQVEDMLQNQTHYQRPLSERHVNRLCEEMTSGTYHFDAFDPIRITSDGAIVDGQHRLSAMKKTGIIYPILVIEGYSNEDFLKIDRNRKKRGACDELRRMGVVHYTTAAAMIKLTLLYRKSAGRKVRPQASADVRDDEVIDYYIENQSLVDSFAGRFNNMKGFIGSGSSLPAVCMIAADNGDDANTIDLFVSELESGIGTGPAVNLRKTFSSDNARPRKLYGIRLRFWLMIQALQRHLDGSSLRLPRLTAGEALPVLSGHKNN